MGQTITSTTKNSVTALKSYISAIADPANDDAHLKAGNHTVGDGIEDVCHQLAAIRDARAVHARVVLEDCALYLPVVGTVDREHNRGILLNKLARAIEVLNQD